MALTYEKFIQHAKKVTDNASETRPVLKGVHHLKDGSAVVTDSHRLYIARSIHERSEAVVLNPKGKVIEGNYPDVSRLIPDSSNQKIKVNVKELINALDVVYSLAKLDAGKVVKFIDDRIKYKSINFEVSYEVGFSFENKMSFNALYVLEALKLFKASCDEEVIFHYNGSVRPILIENENANLIALILPVRTF